MYHRVPVRVASWLLLAVSAVACAKREEAVPEPPPLPPTVTITASDYVFAAPDTIPAGVVKVRLVNRGPSLHHVQFIRLGAGKTLDSLRAALQHPGPPPTWMTPVPGPNPPAPNASSELVVKLAAGNYAIVCFVPDDHGVPHFAKGMARPVVVAARPGATAAEPAADVQVDLTDYAFTFSKDITAGRHTLKIVNAGQQPHELFIAKLDSGVTAQQLVQFVTGGMKGRPPALPLGGASGMIPGEHAFFSLNFTPGEYAILCFLPDAKDGREHVTHGMVRQIHVS
jgi:uncharacterized cupredoxin-like copper-binding protein